MFAANRSRLLCEASSGYYYNRPVGPRTFYLPQDAIAGFRMVSAHAVTVTCVVLAAGAVAGGILATLRTRTAR